MFWGLSVPGEAPRCSASVLALLANFFNSDQGLPDTRCCAACIGQGVFKYCMSHPFIAHNKCQKVMTIIFQINFLFDLSNKTFFDQGLPYMIFPPYMIIGILVLTE